MDFSGKSIKSASKSCKEILFSSNRRYWKNSVEVYIKSTKETLSIIFYEICSDPKLSHYVSMIVNIVKKGYLLNN